MGVPHVPTPQTRAKVKQMAAVSVPVKLIARVIKIDLSTLKTYYEEELAIAKAEATAAVGGRLFKMAMDGDVAAAIFWMKAQAGWSDRPDVTKHAHYVVGVSGDGPGLTHEERLKLLEAGPQVDDGPARDLIEAGDAAAVVASSVIEGKAEDEAA